MNERPLSALAEVTYGKSPNGLRTLRSDYPLYGTGGLVGYATRSMCDVDAIVLPRKGSLGSPWFAPAGFWAIDTTYIARPRDGVDAKWLFYALSAVDLTKLNEATGVPSISRDWLCKLRIPTPEPTLQRRIADLLSVVDEGLAIGRARLSKLADMRAGFVQQVLLPVTAAAEEVPLGAIAPLVTSGSRGWASYYSEEGALFLRIGNLTRLHPNLRFEDVVRVKVPSGGEGARTRLLEGDVLISITADLGIVGCVPAGLGEAYINQHIALARIADETMNPRWVAHALASPYGASQVARLNDGGAKAGLNLPTIRALKVPKVPREQQQKIVAVLDALDAQVSEEQACVSKLVLQKQGLLRELLTSPVKGGRKGAS